MNQSPRQLAAQKAKLEREQKRFLQDLLEILDALDQACDHWYKAEQDAAHSRAASPQQPAPRRRRKKSWLQRIWQHFLRWLGIRPARPPRTSTNNESEALAEVLASAREGSEVIRRQLLEVLSQQQVVPLEVVGQPFAPESMYAVGSQESEEAEENTVVQEVVRGYLWQNRILREPQVIVAVKPSNSEQEP